MSTSRPISAKIIQHAEGLGAPNAELVRRRAKELAIIAGRAEFNEEDWRLAKRELLGGHETLDGNGTAQMVSMVSEHDMLAADVGHHVENLGPEDAGNMAEELIAEGMDEAIHEQMLAARRAQTDEEQEYEQEDEE
ncbi:MAG: hypothetical protein M3463_05480 [Verrucomicrobiota bacterium]|nr:hypothetical protein [Verrucomicrobiota bacterium]